MSMDYIGNISNYDMIVMAWWQTLLYFIWAIIVKLLSLIRNGLLENLSKSTRNGMNILKVYHNPDSTNNSILL